MLDDKTCTAPKSAREFEDFLQANYDRIFSCAYRMLGSRVEAEDLTQDICMSLPRKLQGYRGDCSLRTWLYRVTTNAAIDRLRKMRAERTSASKWQDTLEVYAANGRERTARVDWLLGAMQKLPDDLRVTAALLVEEGITQAEAALALDISPGTIAWRMSEIKKALKHIAKEDDNV